VLLKDVFDFSLEETATLLRTSVAAVKAALHRGRERLEGDEQAAPRPLPSRAIVDRFLAAFNARDFAGLQEIVRDDATVELVGGVEMYGRDDGAGFFTHALGKFPGEDRYPRFEVMVFEGEPIVLGFRFWEGVEGLNDITRLETDGDRVSAIRCYCWCPETLRFFAEKLGVPANPRPYRSPTMEEFMARFPVPSTGSS
jgi:RNA polymerase sigma-70 factor (ECF subfamily)